MFSVHILVGERNNKLPLMFVESPISSWFADGLPGHPADLSVRIAICNPVSTGHVRSAGFQPAASRRSRVFAQGKVRMKDIAGFLYRSEIFHSLNFAHHVFTCIHPLRFAGVLPALRTFRPQASADFAWTLAQFRRKR